MRFYRPNKRVNLLREQAPGFSGARTTYAVRSDFRVQLTLRKGTTPIDGGVVVVTSGIMKCDPSVDVRENDVIQLVEDSTKRYFVESVDERTSAGGRLTHKVARIVRDQGRE